MLPFLLVLLGVPLLALAAVAGLVMLVARTRNRTAWTGLVVLPTGCALLPGMLLLLVWGGSAFHLWARPSAWAFEEVFGVAPPAPIIGLRASSDAGPDFRTVLLAFDRSLPALAAVGVNARTPAGGAGDKVDSVAFGGAPGWWKPSSSVEGHRCVRPRQHSVAPGEWWDDVIVIDCPTDGRIYVLATNID